MTRAVSTINQQQCPWKCNHTLTFLELKSIFAQSPGRKFTPFLRHTPETTWDHKVTPDFRLRNADHLLYRTTAAEVVIRLRTSEDASSSCVSARALYNTAIVKRALLYLATVS